MKFLLLLLLPQLALAIPTKEAQFKASLGHVITNSTMPDVVPGMVVASPSRENPDYYFDWVRDTALTMRSLIDYWEIKRDPKIKKMILTWINAETYRQTLPALSGLGEPKYNIDGTGFTGPWGRPQNDGPALRAVTMIKFANLLLMSGEQDYVLKYLYHGSIPATSVIKRDLEYTAHHWREPSFDLWEEEKGMHFYTLLAQHTALQEGAKLARELGDVGAANFYADQSDLIGKMLKSEFVDSYIGIATTRNKVSNLSYKHSNLDAAPLLALLHNYPYQKLFSFKDPSVKKYIDTFVRRNREIYSINYTLNDSGVALGRYPEDKYTGYNSDGEGNPWFLITIGLAEYYCQARNEVRTAKYDDQIEQQFQRVLYHSNRTGNLSEQFNRYNGIMQGARDLTWSYNAFMTAMMRCGFINSKK